LYLVVPALSRMTPSVAYRPTIIMK
jgi:hypothetical protein